MRQAFKNYDEAGSLRRIQCLKYLVLATMLMESDVDPFDAQEAKPYRQDPDVLAMTNLVDAYQRNNIAEFEKTLKNNRRDALEDSVHGLILVLPATVFLELPTTPLPSCVTGGPSWTIRSSATILKTC